MKTHHWTIIVLVFASVAMILVTTYKIGYDEGARFKQAEIDSLVKVTKVNTVVIVDADTVYKELDFYSWMPLPELPKH